MAETQGQPWGRVDETGTVFVREGDDWREVGQYPDGTPEEALAYFERKYADLAGQVTLLEQRVKRGASASDVQPAVRATHAALDDAHAVGDLASLRARVAALDTSVEELTAAQQEEAKAAVAEAIAYRTSLVEQAEALAAQDPAKAQWKQTTEVLSDLFSRWQAHQHDGPRLPKQEANELWKRFRTARTAVEQARRAFFAELDAVHRDAKQRKQQLIEQAEALVPRGADGISGYRRLLDEWKRSGRAGRKQDDALWARFKAAGDAIYGAKAEIDARDDAEYQENYRLKQELIAEAQPLLRATDVRQARTTLADIQRRWDEIGRVPRDKARSVEEGIRKVEQAVRSLEDEAWRRDNPETKARTQGLASQLSAAIEKLEQELADARAAGDAARIAKAEEALEARKVWLGAIG